ncbi:MAG: amidohydrolase family protein [Gemmatimonadaceae bacterium]|nr:amidohydrolase family protein [Gemmatimonadaceae bacterium]
MRDLTIRFSALALSATLAGAQTIAITGGTVFPVSGPKIENGTVIITNGKITAVGANLALPPGAVRVDAAGKWVTPGLFSAATSLGLSEAGGPQFSGGYNDTRAQASDGIAAAFEAADGINPASTFIRPQSEEGVTTVGVWPSGNWFAGRGAVIDLAGETVGEMTVKRGVGAYLNFSASAANTGARAAMLARTRELLGDAKQYGLRKAQYEAGAARSFAASRVQLEALQPVVAGTMPLVIDVDRASDIIAALALAKEFGLKVVLASATEGWMVAKEIAAAKVPVMVGAMSNIPTSFDGLNARQENPALLRAAGVAVTLIDNGPGDGQSYNVRNIRQQAGNAVAYGMSWDEALRSVTAAPAEALGVADRVGTLAVGRSANVVVWDGDPFEFTTKATHVFIRGALQTTRSRQDELTARYLKLPPTYKSP